MENEFKNKRYTTTVRMRSVYDAILNKKYEYPPVYSVYDNKKESEVIIRGFNPSCYEDIRNKAIELNEKAEQK